MNVIKLYKFNAWKHIATVFVKFLLMNGMN